MPTSRGVLLAFLLFCAAASCAVPGGGDDADDDNGDDDGDDDTEPGDVAGPGGIVPPYAAAQSLIEEYVAFSGEPGFAVAWSLGGEPMNARAAGVAELQTGTPLGADHVFRIGSATKPFIAALVLQLVDEGRIVLDAPVPTYLPEYGPWPGLTVRHLLAMRSGIPDYLSSLAFWLAALTDRETPFAPAQLVAYALDMPATFAPGEGCEYSDTNYVLLGLIVERVTGSPIAEVLRARLFDPLGLASTWLDVAGGETPGLAHGYADLELAGPLLNIDAELQRLIEVVAPYFTLDGTLVDGTYLIHPSFAWTAGGLVSTPRDVAVFLRAWARGELASPAAMAEVMDFGPCEILGGGVEYGLGLERVETPFGVAVGHGGLQFGYATTARYYPGTDLALAVVNPFLPEQFWYVEDELLAALHDPARSARPACLPPDGFFDAATESLLQVRFRGRLIDPEAGADGVAGLSGTRVREDARWRAYGGYGAYAYANGAYLSVETIGPGRTAEWDARSVAVDLAWDAFEERDAAGIAEYAGGRTDRFAALLYDVDEDAAPGITRICFHGVPDPADVARFSLCAADPVPAAPGDPVKVFATVPMTRDPDAIRAYVLGLGLDECVCLDAGWNRVPC